MLDQIQKWSLVGYGSILGLILGITGIALTIAFPFSLAPLLMAILGWGVLVLSLWYGERLLRKGKTNARKSSSRF